ncbi:Putative protein of unknown function [Podospora comata]|uniref:Uncharacterized protein n=1 Tax=Podospora comata TaxID=48703 RepID=A0ABY6S8R9_PODCO|nr:Putative protein of unknown function [Podospora comata]
MRPFRDSITTPMPRQCRTNIERASLDSAFPRPWHHPLPVSSGMVNSKGSMRAFLAFKQDKMTPIPTPSFPLSTLTSLVSQPTGHPSKMATPTTYAQFTPPASCGIGKDLYAVEKTCWVYDTRPSPTVTVSPPKVPECTAVQLGDPYDRYNPDCYAAWSFRPGGATGVSYVGCPVSYTVATSTTWHPFWRTVDGTSTQAIDVVEKIVHCCPEGDVKFRYFDEGGRSSTFVHEGITWRADAYLMPRCRGTARGERRTVTLTEYTDTQGWEKKKRDVGLRTEVWEGDKEVWAGQESYYATFFADGHTCYGNCTKYWLESYTSPVYVPTTKVEESEVVTTTTPDRDDATTTAAGGSTVTVTIPPTTGPGTGGLLPTPTQSNQVPVPAGGVVSRGSVRAGLLVGLMGVVAGLVM